MRSIRLRTCFLHASLLVLGLGHALPPVSGATPAVAWWRMEAPIGAALVGQSVPDSGGGTGRLAAAAHGWDGGSLTMYHEVAGRFVYDPLTGKAYINTTSLRFRTGDQAQGRGQSDYLEVDGGIGAWQPDRFTLEGFLKVEGSVGKWHDLAVLRDPGQPHPHAWSLSTENLKGTSKLRYGGHRKPRGYWGSFQDSPNVNQAGWNHFAYVFDGTGPAAKARLYWNGRLASESSPPPPAYAATQRLYLGGAPGSAGWNGYLDEVRFTAAALAPEQFLQASDTPGRPAEPATPIALGLRKEAPRPLDRPMALDLPPPAASPASVHVPEDAGLVNVKTACGARGDGQHDDTDAIRRAVAAHAGRHATLYFPPGVYIVSEPIDWRDGKGGFNAFLTWQGAGVGRTFIVLRDGAAAFGDPGNPRPIIRTGSIPGMGGANPVTGAGNRAHNNYLMDMTFVVGRDNPGAVGVDFNASNTGAMENIRIVSLDRAVDGLRLNRQVGCLLVKNLEVRGFDVGIRTGGDLYGSTLVNVHLHEQRVAGLWNEGHMVAVEGLRSVNAKPAVVNRGESGRFAENGLLVLIGAELTGGDADAAAIDSATALVARGITATGYGAVLRQAGAEPLTARRADEYVWPAPAMLFDATPARTLNLPAPPPPEVPNPPPERWLSVGRFLPESAEEPLDCSTAIQQAIDAGAEVVYFPRRTYHLGAPVVVRGAVRRMIGFQSWLLAAKDRPEDAPLLVFENSHPVSLERFNGRSGRIEVRTPQPVGLKHIMGAPTVVLTHERATVFSENTVGQPIALGRGQAWYAWQLNIEAGGPPAMVENRGGTFRVLGYKTEKGNAVLRAQGGRSEILGGLWYPAQGVKDPTMAAIEAVDAELSASFMDLCKGGGQYRIKVRETRGSETRELPHAGLLRHWGMSGSMSLFRAAGGVP